MNNETQQLKARIENLENFVQAFYGILSGCDEFLDETEQILLTMTDDFAEAGLTFDKGFTKARLFTRSNEVIEVVG